MIESCARQAKVILHADRATTDVSPGRGSQLAMCGSIYIFGLSIMLIGGSIYQPGCD